VIRRNTWLDSFISAHEGIVHTVASERNIRIHVGIAALVTLLALFFRLPIGSCIMLWIPIGIVLTAELLNTGIEKAVDLVTEEIHPLAKIAKDAASGAVLVSAGFAVLIGIAVFYKPVMDFLFRGIRPAEIPDPAMPISYPMLALILVFSFLVGTSLNAFCLVNQSKLSFNPVMYLSASGAMVLALTLDDRRGIIIGYILITMIFIALTSLKKVRTMSLILGSILGSALSALIVLGLEWI